VDGAVVVVVGPVGVDIHARAAAHDSLRLTHPASARQHDPSQRN
jgi:hypothetical protein